jgi:hypothetical protein
MKLCFTKYMMQRYRAILHFVDPIIEAGHELSIIVDSDVTTNKSYTSPCDVANSSKYTVEYLNKTFGLGVKHLGKVNYVRETTDGLLIYLDGKCKSDGISIPFNSNIGGYRGKEKEVGNTMAQALRERMSIISEIPNSVVIMHPGGGRGFVSPIRYQCPIEEVTRNNVNLINSVLSRLPDFIEKIIIKTHPVPYTGCDADTIKNNVCPFLIKPLKVVEHGTLDVISKSEFVINFGSSTVIWLMGSPKKWINIICESKYNKEYEYHRDRRVRTDKWDEWTGNIRLNDLCNTMKNYKSLLSSNEVTAFYQKLWKSNPVEIIMEMICTN